MISVCVCVRVLLLIRHHAGQRHSGRFTRPGQPGVLRGIPALSSRAQLPKREDSNEQLGGRLTRAVCIQTSDT